VRTGQQAKAFMEFRAVVPSKLPARTPDARKLAGLQIMPRAYSVVDTMTKHSIEESPLQDYYGHDMLPVNVRTLVLDTSTGAITPGGAEAAVLGLDCSVNRPENVVARGRGRGRPGHRQHLHRRRRPTSPAPRRPTTPPAPGPPTRSACTSSASPRATTRASRATRSPR
jgi:hypothetical protein